MNKFLTTAERDQWYGSAEAFEAAYNLQVMPYLEFSQSVIHKKEPDPPPMIYAIVATPDKMIHALVPFFLYDLEQRHFDKLHLLVASGLQKENLRKHFVANPAARVISVIGVCYAWMKIEHLNNESEIKSLPESIKNDPESQEVIIMISDFCEGHLYTAMTIQADGYCKTVKGIDKAVVTGKNRYHRALSGLFKRSRGVDYNYSAS